MTNAIAMYDVTISCELYKDEEEVIGLLKQNCRRWAFQQEESDEGYKHWQVRLSLIKRRRYAFIKKKIAEGVFWLKGHISPTVNAQFYTGDEFYVLKEDTRVAGPWTDRDAEKPRETIQLLNFKRHELRGWQKMMFLECEKYCDRTINLVYNPTGGCGKSIFAEYLEFKGVAEEIPPFRLMDDIFQWVAGRPIKPVYIVDMPRGMKKDRLGDFYSGIEVIKNGVAYDKRYHAKKIRFNRPRVFVFTNELPNLDLMSKDRWVIWMVNDEYEVIELNPGEVLQV